MKYLLLTEGTAYFPELLKPFERAGLYNWMKCLDGEVRLWGDIKKRKHELQNYDVIHINSYGQDLGLAHAVSEYLDGGPKLIVNMDLSINYFDKDMNFPMFIKDLLAADILFSVEPTQVNFINYVASVMNRTKPKKWCVLMPHPIDIPLLIDNAWVDYDKRMDVVAFQYHKYDGHWSIPKIILEKLPHNWLSAMLGYIGEPLPMEGLRHMVMPYCEWELYMDFLKRCKIGFEYRTHKAASRFVMEAGALGIPVVTTEDSHMGQLIYPDLCHPVEDFMGIRLSIERLIEDEEYRLHLAREGLERLQHYDFENSKKRFTELIE